MSELHQRIIKYREQQKRYHKETVKTFKMAIANGLYPEKCLACYEAGITFCKYWNKNFECEQYEKGYGEKIVKKFK